MAKTPFWFFQRLNLVEFKSISDPLDANEYARITARALLAWAEAQPETGDTTGMQRGVLSCIVSAARPRKFLSKARPGGKTFKRVQPGVYRNPGLLFPTYLIVCNELPLQESNYPLLVFASGGKLQAFLDLMIDTGLEVYLNYVVRLNATAVDRAFERKGVSMITKGHVDLLNRLIGIFGEQRAVAIVISNLLAQLKTGTAQEQEAVRSALSELMKPEETASFLSEVYGIELTPEQREQIKRNFESKQAN